MRSGDGAPEATAAEPQSSEAASPGGQDRLRGSLLSLLISASLILVAIGLVLLSGIKDRAPTVALAGHDAPISAGALNLADISAYNSPTLVANPVQPKNLAVASRIDTPFFSCALNVSSDGGRRWTQTPIPAPKGEEAKCYAPDVAFSADGTLYLAFVTLKGRGNVPHAEWISTSHDGGRTLSTPVRVLGPLAFQVHLTADPTRPRRLYMTWLQGSSVGTLRFTSPGNPIEAARSDDGGTTWGRPVRVSNPARLRVVAPSPVVGPKGELYVLYLDLGADDLDYLGEHGGRGGPPYGGRFTLVLARSLDGGSTWGESVVDNRVVPTQRFIVFLPPFPSVAIDRSDRVYASFQDGRFGDPDVLLWSLAPGASRWHGPTRVNDTKPHDGTAQYLPKLSVAPDGRLDALYYDRRADPRNIMNEVSLQSSFDHGRTFSPHVTLSSRPFDSRIGFGAKEGLPDLGSRLGLISDARSALGVWTDTRAGTAATQKQDLAEGVASVTKHPRLSSTAKDALRDLGILLGLVGLAVLGLWVAGRTEGGADRPPARVSSES
ncbi:MAG: sialidase family protein [Solirubrobacteraceae bacterium]